MPTDDLGRGTLEPMALALLAVLSLLILLLPRRQAVFPLLAMVTLMPLGQQFVIAGANFQFFRLLLLVGALRVVLRGEWSALKLTGFDRLFLWWVIVGVALGSLSKPSPELLMSRLGDAYNALVCYFFVRCVIVDVSDVLRAVKSLAWLSLPIAALMLFEHSEGRNLLSVFGGVPEFTLVRNGELRSQGAFRHPILAGAYGAAQVPLFAALLLSGSKGRVLPLLAFVASIVIIATSSSSGAWLALGMALAGMLLWPARSLLPFLRGTTVVAVLFLAAVMQAPVWYLMAKVSSVVGGTGWHRAWLLDQAVAHFDEWWLFGTTYTAHWGPAGEVIWADPNMMDITNHYVMEGVKGGVFTLLLFIALIVASFRTVGRALANPALDRHRLLLWGLGVSMATHCVAFLSVNYFDQTILVWYGLQAMICAIGLTHGAPCAAAAAPARSRPSHGPGSAVRAVR